MFDRVVILKLTEGLLTEGQAKREGYIVHSLFSNRNPFVVVSDGGMLFLPT